MTNSERVALLRATGEEILSGEVVVDDREGQLMVWAADTIATLTRERDEAQQRANEQEAEKEMESHAADVWEMDCKKAEADRDAWKAKAEAAEQRLAEFNAYLADAPTVGRQCPLCRADAELPPLPDGWMRVEALSYGYVILRHHRLTTHILADKYGVEISAQTSENCGITPADLITVLRHAEQAHQQLKEGK